MKDLLISMGYRELRINVWAKPVGFHLFMFELDKKLFTNYFKSNTGELCIWNSEIYEPDENVKNDFLNFLKYTECYTRNSIQIESEFQFFNIPE